MKENNLSQIFMKRAMELALKGMGSVSPNPMVGCVIVKDDRIIGEGWHKKYGGPHAEVEAVNSVSGGIPEGAELYVTLEPCSHFGKTPPCAEMLCNLPFRKIWVSNLDPNPRVAGKGMEMLRSAGYEVEEGLLEKEGLELNKRFFSIHTKKRPYIILKWAETGDGFIARKDYSSKWISNKYSRQLVHKWRSEEDAILVGKNTIIHDDPLLNVRDWKGKDPVRIVVDKELALDKSRRIFGNGPRTLVFNCRKEEQVENLEFIKVTEEDIYKNLLPELYKLNILSVLIEGGEKVLSWFIDEGQWDEIRLFRAPQVLFREGIRAPQVAGKLTEEHSVEGDHLFIYRNI